MWRRLFYWMTGGRPMKRGSYRFTDHITGRCVYYFTDAYGRKWMATSPWDTFRVEVDEHMPPGD